MPVVDILIFAIIAVFLVLRLRNILGTRDGYEQKNDETGRFYRPTSESLEDKNGPVDNVVPLRSEALSGSGVAAIKKADPSFQDDQFLQGAICVPDGTSCLCGRYLSQLRRLLGYDLFNEFSEAIRERNADNESLSLTIDEIEDVQLLRW